MKIEILCTGDEILSGKTVNTNYSYIAQRLLERGFAVHWGTVVGDDRECLQRAFLEAGNRADAVIVNGGLGPTVDDLSQEIAAEAAGVGLVLHQDWLKRMNTWYVARGRVMPENNTKQAMLPVGAEFIDNPIGTACGFAIDIGAARFFFTPGVPKELKRMLDEQIIPRFEKIRGYSSVTLLKRFHSFGIGESRADELLADAEDIVPENKVKLGFQSHYPQLETKLTAHGENIESLRESMEPVAQFVRDKIGDFLMSEDDETLEDNIISSLQHRKARLCIAEMHTAGNIVGRLMKSKDEGRVIRKSITSLEPAEFFGAVEISHTPSEPISEQSASELAGALASENPGDIALVVLSKSGLDNAVGEPSTEIIVSIAENQAVEVRPAHFPGSKDWVRLGATELALDCLRRYLAGLPIYQRIDFEQH